MRGQYCSDMVSAALGEKLWWKDNWILHKDPRYGYIIRCICGRDCGDHRHEYIDYLVTASKCWACLEVVPDELRILIKFMGLKTDG